MGIYLGDKKVSTGMLAGYPEKESDVNFYDWDGTLLYAYTKSEFAQLTAMPPAPDRTGQNLTFEEWNFTLAELQGYASKWYNNWVGCGAIYHTTDNKTHLTIVPTEVCPTIYLYVKGSIANDTTIDWGDGNTVTLADTSNTQLEHTYTSFEERDITIYSATGTHSFPGYLCGTRANNQASKITCFKAANTFRLTSFNDGNYGRFGNLTSLKNISLSKDNADGIFDKLFSYSYVSHLNLPSTIGAGQYGLYNAYSLLYCISKKYRSYQHANGCRSLRKMILPYYIIEDNFLNGCINLDEICILSFATSARGSSSFNNCYKLKTAFIPSETTSMNGSATFANMISLEKLYVMVDTPLTIQTTTFTSLPAFTKIYVPTGTLSTYQSATNWSTYASQMVEYDYITNPIT